MAPLDEAERWFRLEIAVADCRLQIAARSRRAPGRAHDGSRVNLGNTSHVLQHPRYLPSYLPSYLRPSTGLPTLTLAVESGIRHQASGVRPDMTSS